MRGFRPIVFLCAALAFVLGAAVAGAVTASAAPTWRSTAILDIDQPLAVAASDNAAVIDKLSRLRFKYVGLLGTERLARPVADELDEDVKAVRDRLGATADPRDLLLRVTGTADDPQRARRTADVAARVLVDFVRKEQVTDDVPELQRVVLAVVDVAGSAERIGPTRAQILVSAVLGGGLLAGAVLLVGAVSGLRDQ